MTYFREAHRGRPLQPRSFLLSRVFDSFAALHIVDLNVTPQDNWWPNI